MTKVLKYSEFWRFHAIFVCFPERWWLRTLNIINKDQIRCLGGFFRKYAQSSSKKWLKMRPNMTKFPKCTKFLRFYATFVSLSGDFINHNVENVQQRINPLSKSGVWEDKCVFVRQNVTMTPKQSKTFFTLFDFPTQFL